MFSKKQYDFPTDSLIYGGDKALLKNLPWQVYLRGPAGCGATLVSMRVSNSKFRLFEKLRNTRNN